LVNALNGFNEGMTSVQAEEYIRTVMMELQQKKMQAAPQQQAPQAQPDSISR